MSFCLLPRRRLPRLPKKPPNSIQCHVARCREKAPLTTVVLEAVRSVYVRPTCPRVVPPSGQAGRRPYTAARRIGHGHLFSSTRLKPHADRAGLEAPSPRRVGLAKRSAVALRPTISRLPSLSLCAIWGVVADVTAPSPHLERQPLRHGPTNSLTAAQPTSAPHLMSAQH